MNFPSVFHDDQHGTAVITLAALINSLKIVNKKIDSIKIVVSGIGLLNCIIVAVVSVFEQVLEVLSANKSSLD
jgi:malate dehydrogenase (oxaloacetate-decarboxylating)